MKFQNRTEIRPRASADPATYSPKREPEKISGASKKAPKSTSTGLKWCVAGTSDCSAALRVRIHPVEIEYFLYSKLMSGADLTVGSVPQLSAVTNGLVRVD